MSKLKYFIYCRKSSEARDRQALSIDAQKRELTEYAKANGLDVVRIFEESQSAFKLGRPIFKQMMDLCKEGVANGILTWKTDRLARNAEDGGRVIQSLDDSILLEIRTPYELFRQEDNRMMLYMLFGMSNDFSRQISANVKRGIRQKYERGEFLGLAPIGYLNAEVGKSRNIIPDPKKAPMVVSLFELYASGEASGLDLLRKANEMGLTTKYGKVLQKSEIYRMLARSAYYGVFLHKGELHKGSYKPLISKQLFDKVQVILSKKGSLKTRDWVHIYKGLIRCGNCGCSITAETKKKFYKRVNRHASYTYYRCTRRRGVCKEPAITEEELETAMKENIEKIQINRDMWALGIKLLKAKYADEFILREKVKENLLSQIKKIDLKMEKLLNLRVNEEITKEEYSLIKSNLLNEKQDIKEKYEDDEHSSKNWLELAENFFETALQARNIINGEDMLEKRKLIRTVCSDLFLKDRKLQFSFKKPFDVLLKPEMRSNMQGRMESNHLQGFWRPLFYR